MRHKNTIKIEKLHNYSVVPPRNVIINITKNKLKKSADYQG